MNAESDANEPLAEEYGSGDLLARASSLADELRGQHGLHQVAAVLDQLRAALEASRRQFLRLGYDLHDGPLQDVAGMGMDLHFFRSQLATIVEGQEYGAIVVGRVDDIIARLVSLDADLRQLAVDVEASEVAERTLSAAVREVVNSFVGRCTVHLDLDPDLDEAETTPSQRIAVVRIVQGALANVVRHSGAGEAAVTVRRIPEGIEAAIVDEGRGFDVRSALRNAPTAGRIGLIAMRERVRLLGGQFSVDSRPGGPTRVHLVLRSWRERQPD